MQDKNKDLEADRKDSTDGRLTTNQGIPISDNQNSLKAGPRGPTLLEDFVLREKITHFDHERIPERVVHARGSAAHGYFQVYQPLPHLTKAKLLNDPSLKTPVFVRFSTVVGSRGSGDTARDARGFATKFYTEDGIWDLVANNIPVFFIQDAMKFPDLVHAVKPEPHHDMPQAGSAHDNFWDFAWLTPEATHMVMWVMSDRALPRSYRMMEGFGVNTFRLINEAGKAVLVKFHWKPLLGVHGLVWDEAQKIMGKDADFHRRDLWENIEQGNFPEYEFGIQVIEEADERRFDFDPLDATKFWPESLVPVQRVGKLVLNRNPDNFFAETEQVAFCPANVVPGIDFSDDPLLQGRLFSYLDTQLSRLGGPNFHEIPINRPTCPVANTQRDGHKRHTVNVGPVNYQPNSRGNGCPMQNGGSGFVTYPSRTDGGKVRERSESFNDHFSQATLFWNSMSDPEKEHIVDAFRFELGKVETKHIRERMIDILLHVDQSLAHRVAYGIGVPVDGPGNDLASARKRLQEGWAKFGTTGLPGAKIGASTPAMAPELSMVVNPNYPKDSIATRKIAFLIADGVNCDQVDKVKAALMKAGATVELISTKLGPVTSAAGKTLEPDKSFLTAASVFYDAVFVPGGSQSVGTLRGEGDAVHFINEAFKHCKALAAAGEGVDLLVSSNIVDQSGGAQQTETTIVALPGVVADRAATDARALATRFIAEIAQHRHFTRTQKERVPA
ncbi:MAG TPA: catalase [Nannocystis sp.]|jgi:catalase